MDAVKIAIIEDDLAIASMYRMKFEREGLNVEMADNGVVGLQMLEEVKPDILLLDLMMPEMNGDEMLMKLRSTEWGKKIMVIILTNMGKQEAPDILEKLNVDSYIVKAEMTPSQVAEIVKEKIKSLSPK